MKVDAVFFKYVTKAEGSFPEVYLDSGGAATIGIGHLLTKTERTSGKIVIDGVPVKYSFGLSKLQIFDLCRQDIKDVEACINGGIQVSLTQNQFNALVSFAYNIGDHAFYESTLRRKLNAGLYEEVPVQMMRWVYDNGKVVKGLINRRKADVELWNS